MERGVVFMSVCLEDLENGVFKLLLSHTTLLGKSPESILCFFFLKSHELCPTSLQRFLIPLATIVCKSNIATFINYNYCFEKIPFKKQLCSLALGLGPSY